MTEAIELLMGIDCGLTNTKCGLYDTAARPVAVATRPTAAARGSSGRVDLERLWSIVSEACAEAVATAERDRPIAVLGIAVSSVGCVPVCLDADDVPVDTAAPDTAQLDALVRLADTLTPTTYRAVTGYPLDVHAAACRLAAMTLRDRERIRTIVSVADYIAFRLTGRVAREFSTTLSYGLWDHRLGSWWAEGLSAVGLDAGVFGAPVESGIPLERLTAESAAALGLPRSVAVFTGGHDYPCAALAAGVRPRVEVLNVTGTIEILASFHEDALGVPGDPNLRAIKDHHVVPGQYSHLIEAHGAGLVEWLRVAPGRGDGAAPDLGEWFANLERRPAGPPATLGIYVPPRISPVPVDGDPRARGSFVGVRADADGTTRLGAVIEGLCYQTREMLDRQRALLGTEGVAVTAVGGGSRSPFWRQLKSDVLGLPIRIPRITEASALGAALLAGVGAGVYRHVAEASAAALALGDEVVEPDPARALEYAERYATAYLPVAAQLDATAPRLDAHLARSTGQVRQ